ncbi:MAG TPA: uracil-DNA glycosylase [Mycobacteriales bacterium]|nr:uracil-DNA glycosylase [Mycobacteriales bacterium]
MSPRAADRSAVLVAERARECADLGTLAARARGCVACLDLAARRTTVVVGDFPAAATLLLVGEAPGAQEDLAGRPFVGKAGQLLDRLLAESGIDRQTTAVANVLKCRPPDNRAPTSAEAARCTGWLDRQVELADPQIVLTLGGTALRWALGSGTRLRDARETVHGWRGRRLLATYHPSAAIRFGPAGAPMSALRSDLRTVAALL